MARLALAGGSKAWPALCALSLTVASCYTPPVVPGFYGEYSTGNDWMQVKDADMPTVKTRMVFFPSLDGETIDQRAAPCPVVLFAPGFNVPPFVYYSYGEQLASWGYIVLYAYYFASDNWEIVDDMSDQVDWLLAQNEAPGGLFEGAVDGTRIGAAGQSLGGKYAIMMSLTDERIGAVVAIDPVDAIASFGPASDEFPSITPERMPEVSAPLCIFGTDYTSLINPEHENFHQFFLHAEGIAQEVVIANGDHASYVDDYGGFLLDFIHIAFGRHDDNDMLVKTLAARYMTSWFNVHLRGQDEFRTYLTGEQAMRDVEQGLLRIATTDGAW